MRRSGGGAADHSYFVELVVAVTSIWRKACEPYLAACHSSACAGVRQRTRVGVAESPALASAGPNPETRRAKHPANLKAHT